jgi:hypothetical protein
VTIRATILTATATILLSQTAQAATLIPIPLYPNSFQTTVTGINNNNVFTGGYTLPGKSQLGFFGTIDGDYTSFDVPGNNNEVEGRGINTSNEIVGYFIDSIGDILGFERFADGSTKKIKLSKQPSDYSSSSGINSKGVFVAYGDVDDELYSCYGKKARCKSDLFVFGDDYAHPNGINDRGTVVGDSGTKAWVLENGVSAFVTYPNAFDTALGAVNNNGIAAGSWTDQGGMVHAILYDIKAGAFQDLKLPGLHNTYAIGINDAGLVTIDSDEGPFLYCTKKKTCPKQGVEVPDGEIVKAR